MKTILLFTAGLFLISSCHKTYSCKCTYEGSAETYTTGQVKAISSKKAEKRCAGSCPGGTIRVK